MSFVEISISIPPDTAFVAYAYNFPDALSASAIAAKNGWPIVFADTNELNTDTANALANWGIKKVFIIGGTGVVSANVESQLKGKGMSVERLGGADCYETSMKIVNRFDNGSFESFFIAAGKYFPDALAGSVYAVKMNGPIALYDKGSASGTMEDYIRTMIKDKRLYILGRDEVVPQADINALTKSAAFFNTAGEGDKRDAGVFSTPDNKLVTVNRDAGYEVNLGRICGMLFPTYGFTYMPDITKDGYNKGCARFVYDNANNRYGLKISGWRHSYDTMVNVNNELNAILETFYFFCGDKEVAYALWSWFDAKNIDGYANTDDFGFRDTGISENGFSAVMKGVEIEISHVNGVTTVYFK